MSLNQPLLLSSALVHQVLLSPTTYPYKQVTLRRDCGKDSTCTIRNCICTQRVRVMRNG
jgi:hypothetical protein